MADRGQPGKQRRRGAELEQAILEAALEVLRDKGYGALTFEAVAARARTSRSVVYRRWPTREELMIAAIEHIGLSQPVAVPDTGSLREDLIELLVASSEARADLAMMFTLQLAPYYLQSGRTPSDLRRHVLGNRTLGGEQILDRAAARGEIPPGRLTPRVRSLPGDLMRAEVMQTFRPVSREWVEQTVDEVLMPLLTAAP